MAYLGTPPQSGFITTAKQRVTSSTNNYVDLDHAISSIADVIVFVNFVKQDTTNLSLTTSTRITLGGTLVSSDIVEIHYLGKAVNTQTPGTATVTNDMLAGSIALDKLSASGTKSSSTFLRGDNTFASAGLSNWSESSGNLLPSNASYGIYLGVNSATASNLLDDYEEGTWSPALGNFGGSNENFIDPRYTKIGRVVTVSCQLQIGSFPSDGSTFLITGLPFTVKSGSGTTYGTCAFRYTGTNVLGLTFGGNNTQIESYRLGGGGGQNNYNDFGQSATMAFVAQYETDS